MMLSRSRRAGLSLLEVLVALAIFLLSLIAVGQLTTLAADIASEIKWQARGGQLCQCKLAELTCGIEPLQSSNGSFDEAPEWSYTVEATADTTPNLYRVTVTVTRDRPDGSKLEIVLSQWLLDPASKGGLDATTTTTTPTDASGTTGASTTTTTNGGR